MTEAQTLVATLLEDRLEEAGYSYLRVFGPEIPDTGFFYAGANPLMQFMRHRMPNVRVNPDKLASYIDRFTGLGFKFVLKHNGQLIVYSQVNPHVGGDGLLAMERTLGLRQETPVIWVNNKKQRTTAGEFFYGLPAHRTEPSRATRGVKNAFNFDELAPAGAGVEDTPSEEVPGEVDLESNVSFERQEHLIKALEHRFSETTFLKHVDRWNEFTDAQLSEWYRKKGVRISPEEIQALAHFYDVRLAG